jgi:hypothetical protein
MENRIPSISSLHEEKNVKQTVKHNIYSIVLQKCVEKILYTNRHTDKTFVIFEVPMFLIGYPLYDKHSCIVYLMNQLSNNGYIVEFIEPCYIHIDWGSQTKSKPQKQYKPSVTSNNIYTTDPDKLKHQTKQILEKFPNTSKIEYVYADDVSSKKKKKNKNKK